MILFPLMTPRLMRSDDIVPFAMKRIRLKIDTLHVCLRDFPAGGILTPIQSAGHFQSFRSRRLGNEIDDGFVVPQSLSPPIRRVQGEEAGLALVSPNCPRGEMSNPDGHDRVL